MNRATFPNIQKLNTAISKEKYLAEMTSIKDRNIIFIFDECLHKYVITDAIRDENVLRFSVEYIGKYRQREDSKTSLDIKVEDIDTKELLEDPKRLEKIADYVIANHNAKTHNRYFTGMFCVSGIDMLTRYYEIFREKKLR